MADFSTVKISSLPVATSVTDNDAMLVVQGRVAKIVRPSLMKGPAGAPGESVSLRQENGWVQWRMGNNGTWQSLISVSDLSGPSAYDLAKKNGFPGTEREWITSLSAASEKAAAEVTLVLEKTVQATARMNELSDHREYVGEDGFWYRYNEEVKRYENTGKSSKGNVMFALFEIDPATGTLTMETDLEYTGPDFELNKYGQLILSM